MTQKRIEAARVYHDLLDNIDIVRPYKDPRCSHVYHLYVIRTKRRDALKAYLEKEEIATSIHYPIIPQNQKAYSNQIFEKNPIAEELANTSLSLPIFPGIEETEIEYISNLVIEFCKK